MTAYGPYRAVVKDIHDGDTIGLDIDLGFKQALLTRNPITGSRQFTCRLFGINAPELSTPEGPAARDFLAKLLPAGTMVEVVSRDWDAYQGRYDAVVTRVSDLVSFKTGVGDLVSVNDMMVEAGYAVAKSYT